MSKAKILQILSMYHPEGEKLLRSGADVIQTDNYEISHLCEKVKDVDGIVLRAPAKITREVIDAGQKLKVISGAGVGVDNIDVAYATKKGIPVLHAPSVNRVSVAEHVIMFIMALSKSLIPFHNEMRSGNYYSRNVFSSRELKGKRLGLIGYGNIAKEVAKRAKLGLEMQVSAWVREYDEKKHRSAHDLGIDITTDLEKVFSVSDYISIHIPLNHQTRKMINRKYLSLMKPTAYLINTARGAVLDQDALYEMLKNREVAGAGVDVYDPEPPPQDLPLLSLPNVIVTPHVAGTTVECNFISATTVAQNVLRLLSGERPGYIANPEVWM